MNFQSVCGVWMGVSDPIRNKMDPNDISNIIKRCIPVYFLIIVLNFFFLFWRKVFE